MTSFEFFKELVARFSFCILKFYNLKLLSFIACVKFPSLKCLNQCWVVWSDTFSFPARRPDRVVNLRKRKKGTCQLVDFGLLVDVRVEIKESEKRNKYLDLAREQKKMWNMKVTVITICSWCDWNGLQRIRRIGNQRKNRDYTDYSIFGIGQNTQKSPGDLQGV